MKKLIVGFAAVGVVMALRPVVKRRVAQKMKAHCKQMAAHCQEMMGAHGGDTGREAMHQQMRERCHETPAHEEAPAEPVAVG